MTSTEAEKREREALEAASQACPCHLNATGRGTAMFCLTPCRCMMGLQDCRWPGHAAILAYGRAVREADKEAVSVASGPDTVSHHLADAQEDADQPSFGEIATAAIETLGDKP